MSSASLDFKVWLDLGGVYVIAHIRGGAEYGERWHRGGIGEKKQNGLDDFISAADHLVQQEHTTSNLLALHGGSNGGLLVVAVVVQRPDLCRVAVAEVGIFDCLRTELEPNGVYNIPEYGSVTVTGPFHALLTTTCSLLTTHYSLLTTHYSPLTVDHLLAHYSLPTTHYPLLTR